MIKPVESFINRSQKGFIYKVFYWYSIASITSLVANGDDADDDDDQDAIRSDAI